jgi:hypothetical protein
MTKEYNNIQTLCDDWNEIKNFDDPGYEIKWVNVIQKKETTNVVPNSCQM